MKNLSIVREIKQRNDQITGVGIWSNNPIITAPQGSSYSKGRVRPSAELAAFYYKMKRIMLIKRILLKLHLMWCVESESRYSACLSSPKAINREIETLESRGAEAIDYYSFPLPLLGIGRPPPESYQ